MRFGQEHNNTEIADIQARNLLHQLVQHKEEVHHVIWPYQAMHLLAIILKSFIDELLGKNVEIQGQTQENSELYYQFDLYSCSGFNNGKVFHQ